MGGKAYWRSFLALRSLCIALFLLPPSIAFAQDSAPATISLPTFTRNYNAAGKDYSYTVIGADPAKGGATTIPTVLVPITLTIEAPMDAAGNKAVLDASKDAARL